MTIGPVEYIIVGFPGNQFTGAIAPALANLIDNGSIRVLDLLFVSKDIDGNVLAFEFDQLDELASYGQLDGEVGGVIGEEDVAHAAEALEPNSSAALLVWEDVWATEFATAIRDSGGVLVEGGRIPHAVVEAVLAELPSAV
jgi:Family of unknown function (DUF6325)